MTFPPVIDQDKANHDFYGSTIDFVTTIIMLVLITQFSMPVLVLYGSILTTIIIAGAKELVWDKYLKHGTPSWADFGYTVFGGLKVYVPVVAIVHLLVN